MNNILERIVDGRTDLLVDYLAQGHAADAADREGVSLMQWCAYYGDVSAMRYLMLYGASLDLLGENLDLTGAAFHGHWQLCQFLLENGAEVSIALSDTGETALHAALCKANRQAYNLVLRVLIGHGADPNRTTLPGVDTGMFMRDCQTRGETPLHRAAAFGDAAAIQMLLDAGAVVDARDAQGETPLAWASWHLRPAAILRLLCYDSHAVSAQAVDRYTVDHGTGWGGMEANLRGKPHL
jgi:uncharacterized protein